MKQYVIEAGIVLFIVLFMRLTIMDNGFIFGFKEKIGFGIPIQTVEYESQKQSFLRTFESNLAVMQFIQQYSFVVLGKNGDKWLFFTSVKK